MGRAVDCEGMTDRERMAKREGTAECERTASHEGTAVRERPAQGGETALRERIFRAVEALEQPMITSIRELVQINSVEQPAGRTRLLAPGYGRPFTGRCPSARSWGLRPSTWTIISATPGTAKDRIMSAPSATWMWCRPGTAGNNLPLTGIWKTAYFTAGECWTIKGRCWPVSTGWPR